MPRKTIIVGSVGTEAFQFLPPVQEGVFTVKPSPRKSKTTIERNKKVTHEEDYPVELRKATTLRAVEELLEDERCKLVCEKAFLCALGGASEDKITSQRFKAFVKDCKLVSSQFSSVSFDIMFAVVTKPMKEMPLYSFVLFCLKMAQKVYSATDGEPQQRKAFLPDKVLFERFMEGYLLPYLNEYLQPEDDTSHTFSERDVISDLLYKYNVVIGKIFSRFKSTADAPHTLSADGYLIFDAAGSQYTEAMFEEDVTRCLQDLELCPGLVTPFKAAKLIKASQCSRLKGHTLKKSRSAASLLPPEFNELLVRVAVAVYSLPEFKHLELTDPADKLLELFTLLSDKYMEMFHSPLLGDVLPHTNPAPNITDINPRVVHHNYTQEMRLQGTGFCTLRGVTVRFDTMGGEVIALRCKRVGPTSVTVDVPFLESRLMEVSVFVGQGISGPTVDVTESLFVAVSASNNERDYTPYTDSLLLKIEGQRPKFKIPLTLQSSLQRVHKQYCQWKDPYNTTHMVYDKWLFFRRDFSINGECKNPPVSPVLAKLTASESEVKLRSPTSKSKAEVEESPEDSDWIFKTFAVLQPGTGKSTLTFFGFLGSLIRYFIDVEHDYEPLARLKAMVDKGHVHLSTNADAKDVSQDTLANEKYLRELSAIAPMKWRCFDVYNGPILLCTLKELAGSGTDNYPATCFVRADKGRASATMAKAKQDFTALFSGVSSAAAAPSQAHTPMWQSSGIHLNIAFTIHDIMRSAEVACQIESSESFDHLLERLIANQFLISPNANPASRSVVHRAWHIEHKGRKIGTVWNYRGQFCSINWQPGQHEAQHRNLTVMLHIGPSDPHFLLLYKLFSQVDEAWEFRDALELNGFDMSIVLM